jgi:hypothetical protein
MRAHPSHARRRRRVRCFLYRFSPTETVHDVDLLVAPLPIWRRRPESSSPLWRSHRLGRWVIAIRLR